MDSAVLNQFEQTYDEDSQTFTVTIPAKTQLDAGMLRNVPVTLIFSVFWEVDSDESYMQMLYQVTLASQIDISYSQKIGLDDTEATFVDLTDLTKNLILDASSTKFSGGFLAD